MNNQNGNTGADLGYPRLCAHRGMVLIAPENTLPAFELAVASGAKEIELDLWPTKDGDIVVCHDPTVDRTTDGKGSIMDLPTDAIRALNASAGFPKTFEKTRIPLFSEVLSQFGRQVIINIHIKSPQHTYVKSEGMAVRQRMLSKIYHGDTPLPPPLPEGVEDVLPEMENRQVAPYDEAALGEILRLLDAYRCRESVYLTGERDVLITARKMAPDIARCCLEGHMNYSIVENALLHECKRLQFCKGFTTQAMIDKARAHGLHCNLFWADDPEEATAYFSAGIDTILTNDYRRVKDSAPALASF